VTCAWRSLNLSLTRYTIQIDKWKRSLILSSSRFGTSHESNKKLQKPKVLKTFLTNSFFSPVPTRTTDYSEHSHDSALEVFFTTMRYINRRSTLLTYLQSQLLHLTATLAKESYVNYINQKRQFFLPPLSIKRYITPPQTLQTLYNCMPASSTHRVVIL